MNTSNQPSSIRMARFCYDFDRGTYVFRCVTTHCTLIEGGRGKKRGLFLAEALPFLVKRGYRIEERPDDRYPLGEGVWVKVYPRYFSCMEGRLLEGLQTSLYYVHRSGRYVVQVTTIQPHRIISYSEGKSMPTTETSLSESLVKLEHILETERIRGWIL